MQSTDSAAEIERTGGVMDSTGKCNPPSATVRQAYIFGYTLSHINLTQTNRPTANPIPRT
jgi:hypothetical protein